MTEREILRLRCDKVHLTASEIFADYPSIKTSLDIQTQYDIRMRGLLTTVSASIAGILQERITVDEKWPENWLEACKERFLPQWILRRWPVRYKSIHIDRPLYAAVCPHLPNDNNRLHLEFLWEAANET